MSNWQPIQKAPKFTRLLCYREDAGVFIASFDSLSGFPMSEKERESLDDETLFQEDWFTDENYPSRLDGDQVPTHYMPLPATPNL